MPTPGHLENLKKLIEAFETENTTRNATILIAQMQVSGAEIMQHYGIPTHRVNEEIVFLTLPAQLKE